MRFKPIELPPDGMNMSEAMGIIKDEIERAIAYVEEPSRED